MHTRASAEQISEWLHSFFEGGRQGGKASPWGTVGHPLRTLGERCLLIQSVESHTALLLLLTKVTKPSILKPKGGG